MNTFECIINVGKNRCYCISNNTCELKQYNYEFNLNEQSYVTSFIDENKNKTYNIISKNKNVKLQLKSQKSIMLQAPIIRHYIYIPPLLRHKYRCCDFSILQDVHNPSYIVQNCGNELYWYNKTNENPIEITNIKNYEIYNGMHYIITPKRYYAFALICDKKMKCTFIIKHYYDETYEYIYQQYINNPSACKYNIAVIKNNILILEIKTDTENLHLIIDINTNHVTKFLFDGDFSNTYFLSIDMEILYVFCKTTSTIKGYSLTKQPTIEFLIKLNDNISYIYALEPKVFLLISNIALNNKTIVQFKRLCIGERSIINKKRHAKIDFLGKFIINECITNCKYNIRTPQYDIMRKMNNYDYIITKTNINKDIWKSILKYI